MTATIQRRVEALEARDGQPWHWVWRHDHETEEQALQREGIEPGERVIVFGWIENEL
jgi:hypothetical protein